MKRITLSLLMAAVLLGNISFAQDGYYQTEYVNLAQQFSGFNTNGDANSALLPSVAIDNGFGSFVDNPASMALIKTSFFNFGYLSNFAETTTNWQQTDATNNNHIGRFGNAGVVYSVPTVVGSFVVGGGYNFSNNMNRTNILRARNDVSSITDSFKDEGSDYHNIAFETYAIDFYDVNQTILESIFRVGFAPDEFYGITQNARITQRSSKGEFSIFTGAETIRNLYTGISLGFTTGNYRYKRDFLEDDTFNDYNGDFIETDSQGNNGTDISNILVYDELDSEMISATVRVGMVYRLFEGLNLGASYKFPTKMIVTENYYSSIETNLDDDRLPFFDDFSGDFEYAIKQPGQLNAGIALDDLGGFSLSGSVEFIDYSKTEVDLTRDENLNFQDEIDLEYLERNYYEEFQEHYNLVINYKAGAEFRTRTGFELRGGFGYFPAKADRYASDKYMAGGGLGIPLTRDLFLDISTQYTWWEDRSIMYEYEYRATGETLTESIDESISQVNLLVGLKFRF